MFSMFSETTPFLLKASASSVSYGSWSSWSGWQDSAVSEVSEGGSKIREVETQTVESAWKTVYHYYRYASVNATSGGSGSYAYSSSYPYYITYDLDYALTEYDNNYAKTRYHYWYSSSNWVGVYPCDTLTTSVATAWKTQYRYRTRSCTYSYTVSYNANGGSGAPSSQTKTKVVTVNGTTNNTLTLSSTKPTKNYTITYNANGGSVSTATKSVSCTFNKWNTKSDGSGTGYSAGGSFTTNADTTLYAQWSNPTAGTLETPTRTGHSFDGWYTAASGGSKITSSSTITGNTTLYAHWTANTYTVTFNANGGSGAPANQTKTYGVNLTLTSSVPSTSKKYTITYNANSGTCSETSKSVSCTFANWNTSANGSGTSYSKGGTYSNNSEVTLYAQWTDPTAGTLATPTQTNYSFDGWYTAASGGTKITSTSTISGNTTLYAHWTLNAYDIIYDANGGSGAPSSQKKIHNETLTLTSSIPTTVKTYKITYNANGGAASSSSKSVNCTFNKWNTKADGSGTSYLKGASYTNNAAATLYAQWTNPTAGTLTTPTRTGYYFEGWYTAESGGTKITSSSTITGNITIYAHWTANTYTVTFNPNGGTCSTESKSIKYDSTYGTLPIPVYVGHIFDGWFTAPSSGSQYTENSTVSVTSNTTLYAHWTDKDIRSIAVDLSNTQSTYYVGDSFDPSKVTVIVTYSDGETQSINSGFVCSQPTLNKEAQKRVTVTYQEQTAYFNINITYAPLESIEIESLPIKNDYFVNDIFDSDGISIKVIYENGYSKIVYGGFDVNYDFSQSGSRAVTVSYSENGNTKSATFYANVASAPVINSDFNVAYSGETISIPIIISGNPGIMGMSLNVIYDDSIMTPISVTAGNILSGTLNDSISTSINNSFKIVWSGSDDVTTDGVLFNVQFSIADNAYGEYTLELNYDFDDTFNSSWNSVKLDCQDVVFNVLNRGDNSLKIISSNITAETGTIVEVPYRIVNNTNISSTTVTVHYNTAAFHAINILSGDAEISSEEINSSLGTITVDLNNIPLNGIISNLFTIQFEVNYCTPETYLLSAYTTNGIDCEESSIRVVNGNTTLFAETVQIVDDTVKIPIHIQGNTGIMGFKVFFNYDSSLLTPISATAGSAFRTGMMDNNISSSQPGSFYVIWVGNDDISANGECIVLQFRLKNEIENNTIISMDYSQMDTYDSSWSDVELQLRDIIVDSNSNVPIEYTIAFNANGGQCSTTSKNVIFGETYGELPIPSSRRGFVFIGWFDSLTGGSEIKADTKVSIATNQTLYAHWEHDTFIKVSDSGIHIDGKFVFGEDIVGMTGNEISEQFANNNIAVMMSTSRAATGDTINLIDDTYMIYDTKTLIVFGDVNGDGWYDGMDAIIVSCLANGMLSENDVTEAVYLAADCNHDGIINQLDVELLQQAGVLIGNVDQSKSDEELLETNSAYVEYLNLIDQNFETETIEVVEDEAIDPAYAYENKNIFSFLKSVFTFIINLISVFKVF